MKQAVSAAPGLSASSSRSHQAVILAKAVLNSPANSRWTSGREVDEGGIGLLQRLVHHARRAHTPHLATAPGLAYLLAIAKSDCLP